MHRALCLLLLAAPAIQVVSLSAARAKCAAPGTVLAPHDGATLPANPTVYVFVPSYYADEVRASLTVRAAGRELPFELRAVSKTDAFWSFRVAIDTDGRDPIEITAGDATARYAIDPSWTPPRDRAVSLLGAGYESSAWTCSHTEAHFLDLTDAPAYLVEWSASPGGAAQTVAFPHHLDDFWLWGDEQPTTGSGRLGLGHLNCMGETADSGERHGVRYVRVRALYPDGSQGPRWSEPVRVDTDGATVPAPNAPSAAPPAARPSAPRRAPAPHGFDPLPLLGLAAGLLGFALARARLRRARPRTRAVVRALADASIPQGLCAAYAPGAAFLALHAGATADAGAGFGFAIAAATCALVAGIAAAVR